MTRNPCRARIEIKPFVKLAGLRRLTQLLDRIALSQGPVPTTGAVTGFEDGAPVTGPTQLIGRSHTSQTRPQNHHRYVFATVTGELGRAFVGLGRRQQIQGLHHEIGRTIATGGAHSREQLAAG